MDSLERKRLEVQLKKIDAAVCELELKKQEREAEILRIEDHIKSQYENKERIQKILDDDQG